MNEIVGDNLPSKAASEKGGSEIVVRSVPHMPEGAVARLRIEMKKSKCYLEYGAGGSTRMAAIENIPYIFSVESDAVFAKAVRRAVSWNKSSSKIVMKAVDVGVTSEWGRPKDKSSCQKWPDYPLSVWSWIEKADQSPDLILIDGRFRTACFLASLLRAKNGTMIFFDDYVGRENRYRQVEQFLKPTEFVGRIAVFKVPNTIDARKIAFELARQCMDPN